MKHAKTAPAIVLSALAIAMFAGAAHLSFVGSQEARLAANLARMNGTATHARICELMREGWKFRYDGTVHAEPQRPEVTEARRAGDCKDLAWWLAARLNDPNVIFVEGRFDNADSRHAWLEWFGDGKLWVLDPTAHYSAGPIPADETRNPASNTYYAPERLISKYGVFTSDGAFADAASGHWPRPVAADAENPGKPRPKN